MPTPTTPSNNTNNTSATLVVLNPTPRQRTTYVLRHLPKPIALLKTQMLGHLTESIGQVLLDADSTLLQSASNACQQSEQDAFYVAMRMLRSHKSEICAQIIDTLTQAYCQLVEPEPEDKIQGDLCVLANEAMDELLAIENIAKKCFTANLPALKCLYVRINSVCPYCPPAEALPFAPRTVVQALQQALMPLGVEIKPRLLIYSLLGQQLTKNYPAALLAMNELLAARGIMADLAVNQAPAARAGLTKQLGDFNGDRQWPEEPMHQAKTAPAHNVAQALAQACHALQKTLQQTLPLNTYGENMPGTATAAPDAALPSFAELMPMLQVLQNGGANIPADAEQWLTLLNDLNKAIGAGSLLNHTVQTQQFTQGLMGAFLQEDTLAAPLKTLLGRLQIPLAQATAAEPSIMQNGEHSGRQLVNALVDAGAAWHNDDAETLVNDPLYKKMAQIVGRAVNEYPQNPAIFNELLIDFDVFNQREQKRMSIIESRLLAAEEGRIKADNARLAVAQTIAQVCADNDIHHAINDLIHTAWHQVLFVNYLKNGQASTRFVAAAQVLEQLVEQTQARAVAAPVIAQNDLLQQLTAGFELIALNAFDTDRLVKKINAALTVKKEVVCPVVVNAEVVNAEVVKAAAECSDVKKESGFNALHHNTPKSTPNKPNIDECFYAQVHALTRGMWFDYKAANKPVVRCRLAAIIESVGVYIFVNRIGQKVAEKSLLDVALALKNSELITIDNSQLFDRALERVIVSLRKSDAAAH